MPTAPAVPTAIVRAVRTVYAYFMIVLTLIFGGALSGPRR